ncbi:hypothetical protein E2C01_097007 [Portunus trituberculatus]|uniref:Uncharacterized protein n=1 Tax=Portunus trituberculatus TaxID=210409 RepID=A0A5B7K9Z8_PORTR|nr:hypothetical protein [Portunus trituberculatus]
MCPSTEGIKDMNAVINPFSVHNTLESSRVCVCVCVCSVPLASAFCVPAFSKTKISWLISSYRVSISSSSHPSACKENGGHQSVVLSALFRNALQPHDDYSQRL